MVSAPDAPLISIVDDDESVREAITSLLRSVGFKARSFASAENFLGSPVLQETACLILDVRLQTMGMTDQQALDLMTKQAYQETEEATAKLQRAKLTSCQLPTYYAGLKGWLAARDNYAKRFPERTPEQFREAIVLREINDLSYKEIAEVAGVPVGTVMSRLARARAMLRSAWNAGENITVQSGPATASGTAL